MLIILELIEMKLGKDSCYQIKINLLANQFVVKLYHEINNNTTVSVKVTKLASSSNFLNGFNGIKWF